MQEQKSLRYIYCRDIIQNMTNLSQDSGFPFGVLRNVALPQLVLLRWQLWRFWGHLW
jgi:hypothetical protein